MATTEITARAATALVKATLGPLGLADMRVESYSHTGGVVVTRVTGRTWHTREAFEAAAARVAKLADVTSVRAGADYFGATWNY